MFRVAEQEGSVGINMEVFLSRQQGAGQSCNLSNANATRELTQAKDEALSSGGGQDVVAGAGVGDRALV